MHSHVCSMLITHDDLVKISDFGTSRELRDKSTKMSFAGTVAWMAPEVIRNEPVSEKVDIWWVCLPGTLFLSYKNISTFLSTWCSNLAIIYNMLHYSTRAVPVSIWGLLCFQCCFVCTYLWLLSWHLCLYIPQDVHLSLKAPNEHLE